MLVTTNREQENIERAIMLWGEEYKDYNYNIRKCKPGKKCGHYTQVCLKYVYMSPGKQVNFHVVNVL